MSPCVCVFIKPLCVWCDSIHISSLSSIVCAVNMIKRISEDLQINVLPAGNVSPLCSLIFCHQTKQKALIDIGSSTIALMNNPPLLTTKKGNCLLYNVATLIRFLCAHLYFYIKRYMEQAMQAGFQGLYVCWP